MSPLYVDPQRDVDPREQAMPDAAIPVPPVAGEGTEPPSDPLPPEVRPLRSSPPWRIIAILALIVSLLATGVGVGLMAARRTGTATATGATGSSVATSSSTVTLPATVQDLQGTIITVTKATQPSVVEVTSTGSSGTAIGSGEFVTKTGDIVTNDHVVAGYTSFTVTLASGVNYPATLVGADAQDDLAVLKIGVTNATPITFTDSGQAAVGSFVLAIGNPLGLQESTSFGIISALNRTEQEESSTTDTTGTGPVLAGLIQTTAAINPGNSGGALVNLAGQLVGIPTLGATSTSSGETVSGIGFAIPANRVVYVVNQLMTYGHLTQTNQGFLGVEGRDVTASSSQSAAQGVQVAAFATDAAGTSPAQSAGIAVGDIITAVNGQTITDANDLAGAVLTLAPGTRVTVTLQRGTSQMTVTVTLGQRPVGSA